VAERAGDKGGHEEILTVHLSFTGRNLNILATRQKFHDPDDVASPMNLPNPESPERWKRSSAATQGWSVA
jgi:hypothetical protein